MADLRLLRLQNGARSSSAHAARAWLALAPAVTQCRVPSDRGRTRARYGRTCRHHVIQCRSPCTGFFSLWPLEDAAPRVVSASLPTNFTFFNFWLLCFEITERCFVGVKFSLLSFVRGPVVPTQVYFLSDILVVDAEVRSKTIFFKIAEFHPSMR